MSMRVPLPAICLWACLLGSTGCFTQGAWSYAAAPRQEREPETALSVVVPPLVDERPDEISSSGGWHLLPLLPVGWHTLSRPEQHRDDPAWHRILDNRSAYSGFRWEFAPSTDLARAIADEVDAARVFREARFGRRTTTDDFAMVGRIRSLEFRGRILTYGLSIFYPEAWFVLPAFTTGNTVELEIELVRSSTGEILWKHTIRSDDWRVHWMYGASRDFRYPELLKAEMPAMIESLREAVRKLQ